MVEEGSLLGTKDLVVEAVEWVTGNLAHLSAAAAAAPTTAADTSSPSRDQARERQQQEERTILQAMKHVLGNGWADVQHHTQSIPRRDAEAAGGLPEAP
jgi:exonuclease VII large subunit